MKPTRLLLLAPLLLAACAPVSGLPASGFGAAPRPLVAPAWVTPARYTLISVVSGNSAFLGGTVALDQRGAGATTTLTLTGLRPAERYFAAYRVRGNPPGLLPCDEPGAVITGSGAVGTSDTSGELTLTWTVPNSLLTRALTVTVGPAYLGDVALARDVLCSPVTTLHY